MRTLVATVGTNPMPVLLSCLTQCLDQGLDQIVLVHSGDTPFGPTGTGVVAERVEATLRRLLPEPPDLSRHSLGNAVSPSDIDGVRRALHQQVDDLVVIDGDDEILLDYTGGTKAMTAAAAVWHQDMVGDPDVAADLRFYVDETSGRIRHGRDAEAVPVRVPPGLDLTEMAALHGYQLKPSDTSATADEQMAADWFEQAVAAHQERRHCSQCHDQGVVPGPGVGQMEPNLDVFDGDRKISEFDVLVRWGHRVVTIESKTNVGQLYSSAGWGVARARSVFGRATQCWFLTAKMSAVLTSMRDHIAWGGLDPGSDGLSWIKRNKPDLTGSFHHFFPDRSGEEPAAGYTHRVPAERVAGGSVLVVSAAGSARLAAAAAARLAADARPGAPLRVELLTSPQHLTGEVAETKRVVAAATGQGEPRTHRVDLGSVGRVDEQLAALLDAAGQEAVILDGTAGQKSVTAAMALAAAADPRDTIRMVCTDVQRRIRSELGGGTRPAPIVEMPMQTLLSAGYQQRHPAELADCTSPDLHRVTTMVLTRLDYLAKHVGAPGAPTLWQPRRLPGVGGQHQLNLLLVAAWDRIIGVAHIPELFVHDLTPGAHPIVTKPADAADFAATAALYLEALAGDATRTIAVLRRAPEHPDQLRRTIQTRLALAHPTAERPITLCLIQTDGQPEPDTEQIVQRLVTGLYQEPTLLSTGTGRS